MMSLIQCARNKTEQNLEAIQSFGDVYFQVTKDIDPGIELRVFYSDVYLASMGFKEGLDDLIYNQGDLFEYSASLPGDFCQNTQIKGAVQ